MEKRINYICLLLLAVLFAACDEQVKNPVQVGQFPEIVPDYTGVTIPETIAPLNFTMDGEFDRIHALIKGSENGSLEVQGKNDVQIPVNEWHALVSSNKGGKLGVIVSVKQNGQWKQYDPFDIHISNYPIDYGLSYRLIAPGYEVYSKMGIYQRSLADFTQSAIYENTLVPGSCVNCHSFKETSPDYMSLHIRGQHGGTLLQIEDQAEMLNLKTDQTISGGVYPYWHPSGRYIAYSVNTTKQAFHAVENERIEVFDMASDVIVYDTENNQILSTPLLKTEHFETFPAFSPDGKSLYFCCSAGQIMPDDYKEVKYNLCRITFDPEEGTFGTTIDTLVHSAAMGKSVSFPRPSYDGKYLMYTLSDYGNFSIWHAEADLWLLDLRTGETRLMNEVNSPDTESYHSWSSNSRWFVFSSRRGDGLYTRLYLASMDEDGNVTKPFLLPQQKPLVHDPSFFSYNIPEFISAPVKMDVNKVEKKILSKERKQAR